MNGNGEKLSRMPGAMCTNTSSEFAAEHVRKLEHEKECYVCEKLNSAQKIV